MDLTSAVGRVGVKQACMGLRWGYRLVQSEVGKRKERSFCLKCDNPFRAPFNDIRSWVYILTLVLYMPIQSRGTIYVTQREKTGQTVKETN